MARFSCATWRPISVNIGGRMSGNRGLCLHHAVMYGSLFTFFNSPSAQVSAHFWVALDGRIEQYVDSEVVAWHGKSLNSTWCGVETEGCTAGTNYAEPMSEAMVHSLARIFEEGHRRHGWPYQLSSAEGTPGFGFHRMAVATACPCDERLNKRQEILNIAQGNIKPPEVPKPPPVPKGEVMAVTQVVKRGSQLHSFHVPQQGSLWHKWSGNGGESWSEKCLMAPDGSPPVKTPKKLAQSVEASVVDDVLFFVTEEEGGSQWVGRQSNAAGAQWDIRRMAPGA